MKGNTKGFTLVELLAVIVILAIIALITAPAILNIINEARVKGAEDKAWGTIDAVRLAYTKSQGFGDTVLTRNDGQTSGDEKFIVSFGSTNTGSHEKITDAYPVTMSGEAPTSGTVTINLKTGTITCTALKFTGNGKYSCTTTDGNTMTCTPY